MDRRLLLAITLVTACTTTSEAELDEAAIADGSDGKADGYSVTRLERATAAEVATSIQEVQGAALTRCFELYKATLAPTAVRLTANVADKFIEVHARTHGAACADWYDLAELVKGVLGHLGVSQATPDQVIAAIPPWATPKLEAASVAGYVEEEELPLVFYDDLMRVRDANARAREQDPRGVDLAEIRAQWDLVREDTSLDRAYLNPVTFPAGALAGADLFRYLRAAFPLRGLSLEATGSTAIAEFAGAVEGPEGDPAFAPIATALRKRSIQKRFYFAGGGEYMGNPWSSNVLIVIDQHGQAWGFQMGYSE